MITVSPIVGRAFGAHAGAGTVALGVAFITQGGKYRIGGQLLEWFSGGPEPDLPWSKLIMEYAGIDKLGEAIIDVTSGEITTQYKRRVTGDQCNAQ